MQEGATSDDCAAHSVRSARPTPPRRVWPMGLLGALVIAAAWVGPDVGSIGLMAIPVARQEVHPPIDSRRIAVVTGHRLTKDGEEAALLRQPLPHRLPALAAVARSPDRRGGVGWKTSGGVAVQR